MAQEAGPLPSKRGEIGYVEGVHGGGSDEGSRTSDEALPARHPADRSPLGNEQPSDTNDPSPPSFTRFHPFHNSNYEKSNMVCHFLAPLRLWGFHVTTFVLFILQLVLLGGSIAGWVLISQLISKSTSPSSSAVFVHVVFGIALLGQLLFLERSIFRLRVQRYGSLHPGEILPTSRRRGGADPGIGFAPWHRPPVPTYAAALAESGVGTGDVEDHLIAAPPPPAYGNTRYLRESLRAQRPLSVHSQMSQSASRPLSYVSRDDRWEEVQDAERARRLEDTLSQLERPHSRR
ncbi:hypothetical protein BD779DRAFT_1609119 [Infundibulicybe gibba]|nr:hypothetical protein BD779DRAFT_1609119 [Infundibulicybe gibba]